MAKQPERAYQPLVRTLPDTRFYCFPDETTETTPCLSSKLHPEEGRLRQRKRKREESEEGLTPPSKRLRISTSPQPRQVEVEEVEEAEDSSKAREDSEVTGSAPGSWESSGSWRVTSSSGGEEHTNHSASHISETAEATPCLSSKLHSEEGRLRQRKRKREESEEGLTPPSKRLRISTGPQPRQVEEVEEVEKAEHSSKAREDPEVTGSAPGSWESSGSWRVTSSSGGEEHTNHSTSRISESTEATPCLSKLHSEEGRLRQRKRRREDSEESPNSSFKRLRISTGPQPHKVQEVEKAEDASEAEEDSEVSTSCKPCLCTYSTADFEALYEELERLGSGGFGSVFAGFRKEDRLPVAIKHIPMHMVTMTGGTIDGQLADFPLEVSLMLRASEDQPDSGGPGAVVLLLDWFQLGQELILVLERPVGSVDLLTYMSSKEGKLQEQDAKMILHQVVEGLIELSSRDVLHRDIKPENILVETGSDTPRVRIIDLGCGTYYNNRVYTEFCGTAPYIPPEWLVVGSYRAGPLTVWQVGVLLYQLLTGHFPFNSTTEIVLKVLPCIQGEISPNCQDFLKSCLTKQALGRPPLESLLQHPWLQ